jgi:hypothetical protein
MRDRVKEGQMWLLLIIVGWLILSLCGCKQVEYVPVKEMKTVEIERNGINWSDRSYGSNETTMITIKDSVVVVVNQQGEEVRREEWHEKETDREYREKYEELLSMYESLRSEKTDTIQVPYPVERKLGRWEQTCVNYGGEAIVMCVVMLFIIGWIAFKKIFR